MCRGDLAGGVRFYQQQLALAQKVGDRKMEADAYSALGSAHRLLKAKRFPVVRVFRRFPLALL